MSFHDRAEIKWGWIALLCLTFCMISLFVILVITSIIPREIISDTDLTLTPSPLERTKINSFSTSTPTTLEATEDFRNQTSEYIFESTPPSPGSLATENHNNTSDLLFKDDQWIDDRLAAMDLPEKIGQMLLIGLNENKQHLDSCTIIHTIKPGGIFFHPGNVQNPRQLRELSSTIHDCGSIGGMVPLFVAIDHEGEYVNRFSDGVTTFPAALAIGATGSPDYYGYNIAKAAGAELAFSGVNVILGPVADVLFDYDSRIMAMRTYGDSPDKVSEYIHYIVSGYQSAGLIPVLKHFPGHGGVAGDTHQQIVVDGANLETIRNNYLPAFRSGIQAGAMMIMPSHLSYPGISGDQTPATLSKSVLDLLREELHFSGIIISDDMNMRAITQNFGLRQASLQAIKSGVDMLLITDSGNAQSVFSYLVAEAQNGNLPSERVDESVKRILKVKALNGLKFYPIVDKPEPDWSENYLLAHDAGFYIVQEYWDDAQLVPIPSYVENILVVGPNGEWNYYQESLNSILEEKGFEVTYKHFSIPHKLPVPEQEYLQSIPGEAKNYDLVLMFTFESHTRMYHWNDDFQIKLVNRLYKTGIPLIIVALKSPNDVLDFPRVGAFLATYGTIPGAMDALNAILIGKSEPQGVNPLPGMFIINSEN